MYQGSAVRRTRAPEFIIIAMGICFSKPEALDNDRRISFSEDESLCIRKSVEIKLTHNHDADLGLSNHFDLKELKKKQVADSKEEDLFTSSPKSFFVGGVCGSDCFDSSTTTSQEAASVDGSANDQRPYKQFVHTHPPLQLVTTNLSRIKLSPFSKSNRMSSSKSAPVHDQSREDHDSPRSKFMALLVNHLVKSLSPMSRNIRNSSSSRRSSHESPMSRNIRSSSGRRSHDHSPVRKNIRSSSNRSTATNSSAVVYNPDDISVCIAENIDSTDIMYNQPAPCLCSQHYRADHAKSLPCSWNVDVYSLKAAKNHKTATPFLCKDFVETNRSNPSDSLSVVDEVDLPLVTFNGLRSCGRKEFQSLSLGLSRSYSLSLVEGEKAFGSPFSVDSNNLCEVRKEKRRGRSSIDEWSDSSSDLFDIDFRKAERVAAGVAFALE